MGRRVDRLSTVGDTAGGPIGSLEVTTFNPDVRIVGVHHDAFKVVVAVDLAFLNDAHIAHRTALGDIRGDADVRIDVDDRLKHRRRDRVGFRMEGIGGEIQLRRVEEKSAAAVRRHQTVRAIDPDVGYATGFEAFPSRKHVGSLLYDDTTTT